MFIMPLQASLKRKREDVGEEKAEAIKTHVKVNLDMKEQEEVATADAKTQVRLHRPNSGPSCSSPGHLPLSWPIHHDAAWYRWPVCFTLGVYSKFLSASESVALTMLCQQYSGACRPL